MDLKDRKTLLAIGAMAAFIIIALALLATGVLAAYVGMETPESGATYTQSSFLAKVVSDYCLTMKIDLRGTNYTMAAMSTANTSWNYTRRLLPSSPTMFTSTYWAKAYCNNSEVTTNNTFYLQDDFTVVPNMPVEGSVVHSTAVHFNASLSLPRLGAGYCYIEREGSQNETMVGNNATGTVNKTYGYTNNSWTASEYPGTTHWFRVMCFNASTGDWALSGNRTFNITNSWGVKVEHYKSPVGQTLRGSSGSNPIYFGTGAATYLNFTLNDSAANVSIFINDSLSNYATLLDAATNHWTVDVSTNVSTIMSGAALADGSLYNVTIFANESTATDPLAWRMLDTRWMLYSSTTGGVNATQISTSSTTDGGLWVNFSFIDAYPSNCWARVYSVTNTSTPVVDIQGTNVSTTGPTSSYRCSVKLTGDSGIARGEIKIEPRFNDTQGNTGVTASTNQTNITFIPLYTGANLIGGVSSYSLRNMSTLNDNITAVAYWSPTDQNYTATYSVASGATGAYYDTEVTYGIPLWVTVNKNTSLYLSITGDNTKVNVTLAYPGWATVAPQDGTKNFYDLYKDGVYNRSYVLIQRLVLIDRSLANPFINYRVDYNTTDGYGQATMVPRGYGVYVSVNQTATNLYWNVTT